LWLASPELALWQLTWLWLDTDPYLFNRLVDLPSSASHLVFPDAPAEFAWRLDLAMRSITQIHSDTVAQNYSMLTAANPDTKVAVRDFAVWALKQPLSMPDELRSITMEVAQPAADAAPSLEPPVPIPAQLAADPTLADIQQAYDKLHKKTGKAPSQRAVERESGYSRETVRNRWKKLDKGPRQ